mgnify:CR=1 FL=1
MTLNIKMDKKQILFLPSSGNQIKFFSPILKEIENKFDFLFLTQGSYKDEGVEHALQHLKIPFKTIDEYSKLDPDFILEQENIGLIIVGNDSDVIPQWFINSGKKKQISSILIQDGLLLDVIPLNNNFFNQISFFKNIKSKKLFQLSLKLKFTKQIKKISYGQAGCTQIHVWTNSDKKYLLKKKIPYNSIHISGNIKFNDPTKISDTSQTKNPLVLYASTDLIHTKILEKNKVIKIVDDICKTISSIPNMKLIIKPHPIEEKHFYNIFERNYNPIVKITDDDVNTLIQKSKFLITNLSAITFEALFQKKPIIIYFPELEKIVNCNSFPFDLISKGILLFAKNPTELLEKIHLLEDNSFCFTPSQLEIISDYLGQRDDSISKIITSINQIMI